MIFVRLLLAGVLLSLVWPHAAAAQDEEDTTTFIPDSIPIPWYVKPGDAVPAEELAATPFITSRTHNNGKFWNTIMNNGMIGNPYNFRDPLNRGRAAPSFFYPLWSNVKYTDLASLWVGGIVDGDTLVSCGLDETGHAEFYPDPAPFGDFIDLSGQAGTDFGDLTASRAEQIYQCTYTDTSARPSLVPYSSYDQRYHRPLGIKVTQTSYSWAYGFAEDFMIVDYVIENISNKTINDVWVGLYTYGFIQRNEGPMIAPRVDDIEGYIDTWPYELAELGDEKIRLVYACDNDGEPLGDTWGLFKVQHVIGFAPLGMPPGATRNNFNWWTTTPANWGPRLQGSPQYPFRTFPNGLGIPYGDKSKYYMMYKPEIDIDGLEAAQNRSAQGWLPPIPQGTSIARGHYVHTLSSFGPVRSLRPGGSTRLTMVIAMGEFIHSDPSAYRRLFNPNDQRAFKRYLMTNIEDLIDNVRTAKAIYDNPGVDTDGDGDAGRYVWRFNSSTGRYSRYYYEGDGYPDFRGTEPPPAPKLRVSAVDGKIIIRWNGEETETATDNFTGRKDFEGYNVWLARTLNDQEWQRYTSYDIENYNRYHFDLVENKFVIADPPFTIDSLRELYGEDFDPLSYYEPAHPFIADNEVYYFKPMEHNANDLTNPRGIHKIYPDAILDSTDVDEEGRLRYFEYECILDELPPTVPYFVAVTAFDHGSPDLGVGPLENGKTENAVETFARTTGPEVLKDGKLNVYVFPNPYRIDAEYQMHGYENRLTDLAADRARSIWFANLPDRCKISIYSIDGDLIKVLDHDELPGSGFASVERFDLITRNRNALTTGLYYWVIESEYGNQIGKFMVIK